MHTHKWTYLLDIIDQSFLSLIDNKLRSILSIVGVSMGVAAVIIVSTVSEGGKSYVLSELETFGLKSVWVMRDWKNANDPTRTVRKGSGINNSDYLLLQSGCCSAINRISPIVRSGSKQYFVQNGSRYSDGDIIGVSEHYIPINNDRLQIGRNIRQSDINSKHNIAIIGSDIEKELFGHFDSAIGKQIKLNSHYFTVVGILAPKSRDFLASIGSKGGQDTNHRILIPYNVYQAMLGMDDGISSLQAEANDIKDASLAAIQIIGILNRKHRNRYDYKSEMMAQYIATTDRILQGVSIVGIVAASISLLVGGMGIMNIMSTSVIERTREIGLRKAIGARKHDILLQFLMEAISISGVGGVLGLLLGGAVSLAIATIAGFPMSPSWLSIVMGLILSIVVGLASGYYPARRASSMLPVAALRYE